MGHEEISHWGDQGSPYKVGRGAYRRESRAGVQKVEILVKTGANSPTPETSQQLWKKPLDREDLSSIH